MAPAPPETLERVGRSGLPGQGARSTRDTAGPSERARFARRVLRNRNVVIGGSVFLLLVLVALLAGALSPYNPTRLYPGQRLKPPGAPNFLGTDEFGRDILSLVLHGSRVSLLVGGVTMVLTSLGGVVIGLIAGYYRRLDIVIMRVMDGLMAFPAILLAIALMAARGPGVWNVILSLSIVYLPRTAMLIRSTALERARAGLRPGRAGARTRRPRDRVPPHPAELHRPAARPGHVHLRLCRARRGHPGLPRRRRAALRAVVGQRDRQRQERHPRGLLGEPLPRASR